MSVPSLAASVAWALGGKHSGMEMWPNVPGLECLLSKHKTRVPCPAERLRLPHGGAVPAQASS